MLVAGKKVNEKSIINRVLRKNGFLFFISWKLINFVRILLYDEVLLI